MESLFFLFAVFSICAVVPDLTEATELSAGELDQENPVPLVDDMEAAGNEDCCRAINQQGNRCANIKRDYVCEHQTNCVWDCGIPPEEDSGCCVGPPNLSCPDNRDEVDCVGGCRWHGNCVPGQRGLEIVIENGDNDEPLTDAQRKVANGLKSIIVMAMKSLGSSSHRDNLIISHKDAKWYWETSSVHVPGIGVQTLEEDANFYDLAISAMTDMAGRQTTHDFRVVLTTEIDEETGQEVVIANVYATVRWERNPDVYIPLPVNENDEIELPFAVQMKYTEQDGVTKCKQAIYDHSIYSATSDEWLNQFRVQAMANGGKLLLMSMKTIKGIMPTYNAINVITFAVGSLMIILGAVLVTLVYKWSTKD